MADAGRRDAESGFKERQQTWAGEARDTVRPTDKKGLAGRTKTDQLLPKGNGLFLGVGGQRLKPVVPIAGGTLVEDFSVLCKDVADERNHTTVELLTQRRQLGERLRRTLVIALHRIDDGHAGEAEGAELGVRGFL